MSTSQFRPIHSPSPPLSSVSSAGFTLLEMLLVVGILSSLALSATLFVDNRDDQRRFEETAERMRWIRRAIVGDETMAASQFVPEGFVADNGLLPSAIDNLLANKPVNWTNQTILQPVFDTTPDANGLNDDAGTALLDNTAALIKGFRGGYVLAPAGAENTFGDAWRKAGSAPNFGWGITASTDYFSFTTRGKDGTAGGTAAYDIDVDDTLSASQWSSPVAGLSFSLIRSAETPFYRDFDGITATFDPRHLRLALLVFRNVDNAAGKWQRFVSEAVPACIDNDADNLVDHDNDDANNNGVMDSTEGSGNLPASAPHSCPSATTLIFPTVSYASPFDRIPLGKHLLVLLEDPDLLTANDEILFESDNNNDGDETLHLPVTCRAGGCPHATLILR